jgi:hypothetical protein
MPSVSDTGATAPISALTYAFSIGLCRGLQADDFEPRIIGSNRSGQVEGAGMRATTGPYAARIRTA